MRTLIFLVLVAAIAAGGYFALAGEDREARVVYQTGKVARGPLVSTVTASGTIEALVTVEVGSQLSGQIVDVAADYNEPVHKGQELARLDGRPVQARIRQAEAELEMAAGELRRKESAVEQAAAQLTITRHAHDVAEAKVAAAEAKATEAVRLAGRKQQAADGGAIPVTELEAALTDRDTTQADLRAAQAQSQAEAGEVDSARAALHMAEAEVAIAATTIRQHEAKLEQLRLELEQTIIRSPIEGMVIRRDVDPGQTVAASFQAPTLFTIAKDPRVMHVEVNVDEADIGQIQPSQPARFTVDAYPERTFVGSVKQVRKAPEQFQNVVTYTVIVLVDNADQSLLPGMSATVRIVTAEKENVLTVPTASLRYRRVDAASLPPPPEVAGPDEGQLGVIWILEESGKPRPLAVRTGVQDGRAIEILTGRLEEGQDVVVGVRAEPDRKSLFDIRWRL